jgi:hypothetical protein
MAPQPKTTKGKSGDTKPTTTPSAAASKKRVVKPGGKGLNFKNLKICDF